MLASTEFGRSLAGVPVSDRIDVWRELCRETFLGDLVWMTDTTPRTFAGSIRRRWIDDVLFVESEASRYGASYANDTAADGFIGFGFSAGSYGEQLTMRDSTVVDLRSKTCVWANSRVRRYEQSRAGHSLLLYVPVVALRAHAGSVVDRIDLQMQLESPTTRVMCAMLQALSEERQVLEPDEALALRNSLVELMASIVADRVAPDATAAVSGVMRRRVTSWIDSRIHCGPVSPAEAAATHGISIRSLQRLFEDGGGSFSATVRAARLARARKDVVGTSDSLQAIAMRWDFADPSHFTREFRKVFGMTPSEVRAEGPAVERDLLASSGSS